MTAYHEPDTNRAIGAHTGGTHRTQFSSKLKPHSYTRTHTAPTTTPKRQILVTNRRALLRSVVRYQSSSMLQQHTTRASHCTPWTRPPADHPTAGIVYSFEESTSLLRNFWLLRCCADGLVLYVQNDCHERSSRKRAAQDSSSVDNVFK